MINILILEDEKYTREFMKKVVLESPLVDQVFATGRGNQAISIIQDQPIHIALIDIELDEKESLNGLEIAKIIHNISPSTEMIFTTGYAKYAVDSFSVHPYDYFLKPINTKKLVEAINILATKAMEESKNEIIVKNKNEIIFIPVEDILFIEKQDNHIIIHIPDNEYKVSHTLMEMEGKLPNHFLRVHKSYIVNKKKISKVIDLGNRSYRIQFTNSKRYAYMSRYKYNDLKEYFVPSI